MNRPYFQRGLLCAVFFIVCHNNLSAQNLRSFNQNASRSNHTTRSFNQNASRSNHTRLSLAFTPVYSTAVNNSSDSLLFRGNGAGFRFGADYFFGKASIGFSSGFSSSAPDDATINDFIRRSGAPQDQLQITKSRQQNMYLLLGPSVRFGNMVELYAHAKGGLFVNNSGLVSIQQKGAQRVAYRNESTGKSIYPGFFTGVGVQYNTRSETWSFGIGADYMNTKSEVMNYDARRGGAVEGLKLSRNITDIVTGITIRYNIKSPRDAQSGQASGRRVLPTVNKREVASSREAGSGMATGRRVLPTVNKREMMGGLSDDQSNNARVLPTVNKREIAIDEPGVLNTDPSCGPVTLRTTNADGTTTETTFSCPEDAAAYAKKIDTKKQKQWVPANCRTASNDAGSYGIISGRLTWPSSGTTGIVTNTTINAEPRSGSTTLNSQSSSTRQTPQTSFGTLVRLGAREAGSGMATGKRSREAGSGMATGRRQYQPVFIENGGTVCNPCIADAQPAAIHNNPLYQGNGTSGNNPLHKDNARVAGNTTDDDCDGIAGIDVYLLDIENGSVVSKTQTAACGDFFFANVPEGDYVVRLSGSFLSKKGYDIAVKSKTDLAGSIEQNKEPMQLFLNTEESNDGMAQKAGISTSRSNIRTKSLTIIEADLDGDGEYESLSASGMLDDGSSQDITTAAQKSTVSNTPGTRGIILGKEAMRVRRRVEVLKSNKTGDPNANRITNVTVKNTTGKLTAIATFADGSSRDITESLVANTGHGGVKQYTITVADTDDDGEADAVVKTKTKSNQSNDRIATGDVTGDGLIWSPRSNIKMINVAAGDFDGDGISEMIAAPFVPGAGVVSAARAGDPVHGVDVKLGFAGKTKAESSDEYGEFEFTNLDAGSYTLLVSQDVLIDDETVVTVGSRAQDHNSSRSNKTASNFATEPTIDAGDDNVVIETNETGAINFRWTPLVPKPKEPVTYKLRVWQLMQGQNGTQAMRSNKPIAEKTITNTTETAVQGILTGPCKPPYLCDFVWSVEAMSAGGKLSGNSTGGSFSVQPADETEWAVTKAQDHNSSRSNKTASVITNDPDDTDNPVQKWRNNNTVRSNRTDNALIINDDNNNDPNSIAIDESGPSKPKTKPKIATGPVKWTAPEAMKKAITTSNTNLDNMLSSLDALEQQLDNDQSNAKALINTSRSNIKSQRAAINNLEQTLNELETRDKSAALNELQLRRNETDLYFLKLRESVQQLGPGYSSISNVLKTRHDIAMNAIRNMK